MSYPPQQPGPYGPQDPYGQQQPQYGQQPYGQQPQFGGPQYGGQWGQPGYPGGPPPKKSKAGLIATLVIVAVLLIGGGVTAFFLLKDDKGGGGGGGGGADARATADSYTAELGKALSTAVKDVDLAPLKPLSCKSDFDELSKDLKDAQEEGDEDKVEKSTFAISNFKETSEGATFDMTPKRGTRETDPMAMKVLKEDGNLVVCGLYDQEPETGDPTASTEKSESEDDDPPSDGTIPNPIPKTTTS